VPRHGCHRQPPVEPVKRRPPGERRRPRARCRRSSTVAAPDRPGGTGMADRPHQRPRMRGRRRPCARAQSIASG
jgi:hypothetical protein